MSRTVARKTRPPLSETALRDLALHYVGRYATTRAKLIAYLSRKLMERGWAGEEEPDPEGLADRFAELGYIDDAAFAAMKGGALTRRGYGARRVGEALRAAGIEEADRADAQDQADREKWQAADIFARRRRFGPYAREAVPRELRDKQIAAFLRAGHDFDIARRFVTAEPGQVPEPDD